MPDCQMCWNDWPTLAKSPFPAVEGEVLCRNCVRDHKHVIAFTKAKGFALTTVDPETGEVPTYPQAGLKLSDAGLAAMDTGKLEEEPPSPPAKGARKAR